MMRMMMTMSPIDIFHLPLPAERTLSLLARQL